MKNYLLFYTTIETARDTITDVVAALDIVDTELSVDFWAADCEYLNFAVSIDTCFAIGGFPYKSVRSVPLHIENTSF